MMVLLKNLNTLISHRLFDVRDWLRMVRNQEADCVNGLKEPIAGLTNLGGKMKIITLAVVVVFASLALVRAATDDIIIIGFTASETGKLNADSTPQLRGFQLCRD